MKVLYVGELSYGATARMRMQCLQRLGHQVEVIDVGHRNEPGYVVRNLARLLWRFGRPLDLASVNSKMIEVAQRFGPDLVWVDKGVYVRRDTIRAIKWRLPAIRCVHYNPDDPFGRPGKRGWRTFIDAIAAYDAHFVPRRENVAEYYARGARAVFHSVPTRGFDPEIHRPYGQDNELQAGFASDVGFLGAFEEERAASLCHLARRGIKVRLIYEWPDSQWHVNFLRSPRAVRGVEYAKAIGSLKICLGFLRKANRDQHNSRSIEIPACGTFLLAERTEEHAMLFDEGREAEFFSSDEELLDKTRFYLANEAARNAVARAGRDRCVRSGYDYQSRMQRFLELCLINDKSGLSSS